MRSIIDTILYDEVLKEFNYKFGDVFVFKNFVVSEIKEGISFSWEEHAQQITKAVANFTKCNGRDLIYLSHRINSYSVMPADWLRFYRSSLALKSYGIIGYSGGGFVSAVFEGLFFKKKIRRFNSLEAAVHWAKSFEHVEVDSEECFYN